MAQKWLSLNACSRCNFTHGWLLWLFFARSLCENSSVSRKQASEEKENHYKETHSQPLLQWVIHFWGSLWADPGINSLTSCSKLPSALCCLLSFLSLVWSCPLYMWLFCDLLYFCLFNLLLWMLWVFSTFVFFSCLVVNFVSFSVTEIYFLNGFLHKFTTFSCNLRLMNLRFFYASTFLVTCRGASSGCWAWSARVQLALFLCRSQCLRKKTAVHLEYVESLSVWHI